MRAVSTTDDLVANAARYAERFEPDDLSAAPVRRLAVVACMDARLDLFALLGLHIGDAHIIRNAGGIVTDDIIRSLLISQRMLGTTEVALIRHTGCGLLGLDATTLADELESETGTRPPFEIGSLDDLDDSVRESVDLLRTNPLLLHRDGVRGFVYDVATGKLREIS
jgi:carbonic anhydrase